MNFALFLFRVPEIVFATGQICTVAHPVGSTCYCVAASGETIDVATCNSALSSSIDALSGTIQLFNFSIDIFDLQPLSAVCVLGTPDWHDRVGCCDATGVANSPTSDVLSTSSGITSFLCSSNGTALLSSRRPDVWQTFLFEPGEREAECCTFVQASPTPVPPTIAAPMTTQTIPITLFPDANCNQADALQASWELTISTRNCTSQYVPTCETTPDNVSLAFFFGGLVFCSSGPVSLSVTAFEKQDACAYEERENLQYGVTELTSSVSSCFTVRTQDGQQLVYLSLVKSDLYDSSGNRIIPELSWIFIVVDVVISIALLGFAFFLQFREVKSRVLFHAFNTVVLALTVAAGVYDLIRLTQLFQCSIVEYLFVLQIVVGWSFEVAHIEKKRVKFAVKLFVYFASYVAYVLFFYYSINDWRFYLFICFTKLILNLNLIVDELDEALQVELQFEKTKRVLDKAGDVFNVLGATFLFVWQFYYTVDGYIGVYANVGAFQCMIISYNYILIGHDINGCFRCLILLVMFGNVAISIYAVVEVFDDGTVLKWVLLGFIIVGVYWGCVYGYISEVAYRGIHRSNTSEHELKGV
jgi:hypothetical protein